MKRFEPNARAADAGEMYECENGAYVEFKEVEGFIQLVRELRLNQKRFFKGKSGQRADVLGVCKSLEKRVDEALKPCVPAEPDLFGEEK